MKTRELYSSEVIRLGEHTIPYILYNDATGLDDDEIHFLDGFLSEVVMDTLMDNNLPCEAVGHGHFEVGELEHMTRCDLTGAIGDNVQIVYKVFY